MNFRKIETAVSFKRFDWMKYEMYFQSTATAYLAAQVYLS